MPPDIFEDDPFGKIKTPVARVGPPPKEVNEFHSRSDVDSDTNAQHHTLGIKHTQAAVGDHVHDGVSSRKAGTGLNLTLTGSKGGNVALTNLINMLKTVIEFTDTTT